PLLRPAQPRPAARLRARPSAQALARPRPLDRPPGSGRDHRGHPGVRWLADLVRAETEPFRQVGLGQVTRRQVEENRRRFSFLGAKPIAILTQKDVSGHEGYALVAVEERMIAREAECVACRQ